MAVLCEAISVIIKKASIEVRCEGGFSAFLNGVPNNTLCDDGELVRVGFMSPDLVKAFVDELVYSNLRFHRQPTRELEQDIDIAVVDQQAGLTTPCDWLLVGRIPINPNGDQVTACWLAESKIQKLYFPENWNYDHSLSKKFHFSKSENVETEMKYIRTEGNLDVYLNVKLGIEVFTPKQN